MFKQISAATLTLALLVSPVFGNELGVEAKSKEKDKYKIAEDFSKYYEKYRDFDKAQEKFEKKYPEMELVMDRSTEENSEGEFSIQGNYSDVDFSEAIYYSNDSHKYYYYGNWDASAVSADNPWDMIGVSTTSKYSMPLNREVIVKGYNSYGNRTVYVNTATGYETGDISQGTDNSNQEQGVGFWIDERDVRTGTITAFLDGYSSSEEVQMQYDHSWTGSSLTGIGGNVDVKSGGGFNVTWENNIYSTPHYSYGTN